MSILEWLRTTRTYSAITHQELSELTELDLWNNQLTKLPETIGQLTKIKYLNLIKNQLTTLPETIGQLTGLEVLDLYSNQLTKLPEEIGQLKGLLAIELRSNRLTNIPETIGNLTGLEELYLGGNQLTNIPETIGQLIELERLYLDDNQLTNLPETIGQLTKLKELSLGINQLTNLPETIGQLTELEYLSLSRNRLNNIPEIIGKLTKLKVLYLNNNQLITLPEGIGNLKELKELKLDNNQLTSIPESIGQLTGLKELYLGGNPFIYLNDNLVNKLIENNVRIYTDSLDDEGTGYYLSPTKSIDQHGQVHDCNLNENEYIIKVMNRITRANNTNLEEVKNYLFTSLITNLRPERIKEINENYGNNERMKEIQIKNETNTFKYQTINKLIKNLNPQTSNLLSNYYGTEVINYLTHTLERNIQLRELDEEYHKAIRELSNQEKELLTQCLNQNPGMRFDEELYNEIKQAVSYETLERNQITSISPLEELGI